MATEVAAQVKRLVKWDEFLPELDDDARTVLERLVSDSRMDLVWRKMLESDPAVIAPFFNACIDAIHSWRGMSKTPTKQLIARVQKVAAKADELSSELLNNIAEIALVDGSLVAGSVKLLASDGKTIDPKTFSPTESDEPVFLEPDEGELLRLVFDLQKFTSRLQTPELNSEPAKLRPTKPGQTTAYRTFLVRALTSFFLKHRGRPHSAWVASGVAALLDMEGDLSPDLVSKLVRNMSA